MQKKKKTQKTKTDVYQEFKFNWASCIFIYEIY